jgi:hypothetical protein
VRQLFKLNNTLKGVLLSARHWTGALFERISDGDAAFYDDHCVVMRATQMVMLLLPSSSSSFSSSSSVRTPDAVGSQGVILHLKLVFSFYMLVSSKATCWHIMCCLLNATEGEQVSNQDLTLNMSKRELFCTSNIQQELGGYSRDSDSLQGVLLPRCAARFLNRRAVLRGLRPHLAEFAHPSPWPRHMPKKVERGKKNCAGSTSCLDSEQDHL